MKLNELPSASAPRRRAKRVGRGIASGLGKTCGKGQKGQLSRSGGNLPVGFEGGQMPLQRRLPKRGFTNRFRKTYALLKIRDLDVFEADSVINEESLRARRLLGAAHDGVKLLADGELSKPLKVYVDRVSKAARAKVEAVGGEVFVSAEGE